MEYVALALPWDKEESSFYGKFLVIWIWDTRQIYETGSFFSSFADSCIYFGEVLLIIFKRVGN